MKKTFISLFKILLVVSGIGVLVLYWVQERLIFHPQKLSSDHQYRFDHEFEEFKLPTPDGDTLNALLFTVPEPKGLIFYLHGNGQSLETWGPVAFTYTQLGYDVFMMDYRGYGKSTGKIYSQQHMYEDVQLAYAEALKRYPEENIVVLGYSIGTGLAAKVASSNHPRLLILQAPYYNLVDLVHYKMPFVPSFLIKYKFQTDQFLPKCKMPIVMFHGDQDEVIYYESSVKLRALIKANDTLITLKGQAHNGITENADYLRALPGVLH